MKPHKHIIKSLLAAGMLAVGMQVIASDAKIANDLLAHMDGANKQLADSSELIVSRNGAVAVTVILDSGQYKNPAEHFGKGRNAEREALQADIRQTQDAVVQQMSRAASEGITYRFQAQHAISADLTPSQIREVAALDGVVRIEAQPRAEIMDAESLPLTNTDDLHSSGYTGDGITVAIIDDGIESGHAAFGGQSGFPTSKIVGGYDFADNDSDPRNDCQGQSHGTATTGVAVGNGGGVTGTAPDAEAVFLKIQSSSICGQPGLDGDIIGAIDWVVSNQSTYDISIISMSLGGGSFSSVCDSSNIAYRNAVNAANSAGIIVLAASGNGGLCNQISRPACLSNVISVGATYDASLGQVGFCVSSSSCASTQPNQACPAGYEACFENGNADGVTCYSNSASFLDILAPSNCATTAATGGGTNDCFGGTSSATPFAAGLAASLLEAAGGSLSLDNDEMRSLLADNGVNVTDSKNGRTTPRVDAQASFDDIGGGGGGGTSELDNGVPVTSISGGDGSEQFWTIDVPSGASDLEIEISGGSGDADLYVQYGSAPTTGSYDCRPWLNGNNETCTESSPTAGTWHVMIRGYDAYSGVTLVASYTESGGGGGGAPCTSCDEYTGTLSGSSDSDIQPGGTYYYSGSGTHHGWLSGPASADFDLRLQRWNGGWSQVDSSLSYTSEEEIEYSGSAGYYRWVVESYSGSGNYTFWLDQP